VERKFRIINKNHQAHSWAAAGTALRCGREKRRGISSDLQCNVKTSSYSRCAHCAESQSEVKPAEAAKRDYVSFCTHGQG
jgi:hypothetical protein